MQRRQLYGKRIILTGATSGIGWSLACALIGAGSRVVVDGRRSERLERLHLALGNSKNLTCVPGDLCQDDHRQRLLDTAVDQMGGLDILINNAGVGAVGAFEQSSSQRMRQVFELNFFAATELTRLAIPQLKQGNSPAICNISSVLAYRGIPLKSEYCATKFALRGWSESLRVELKHWGIDVLTVSPSTTKTEFFQSLSDLPGKAMGQSILAQTSDQVARSTLRALERGHRESILSAGGKALVWFSGMCPRMTDRLLQKLAMA